MYYLHENEPFGKPPFFSPGYLEDKNLQFRSYDYSEYYKSLGRAKKDPKPNHRSNSVVHRILNLDSQV